MAAPRALVTGVAGFIGSHVAEHCLRLKMDVVGADDMSGGKRENVPVGVTLIEGDLRDDVFVRDLWGHGEYDYVYHLAAYAAEGLSHFIRRFNYDTNLLASVNLINQAVKHRVKCFVFTSSIAVYGKNQLPMIEDMTPSPEDPYGISKLAVELDLKAAHEMFGLNFIVFRPHNVYGERQNLSDKYRNVIGIFMRQCLMGQPMTIFGDGLQTRAFSYIDDVAPIIARGPAATAAHNEVFNIGADEPYTVLQIAQETAASLSVPVRIEHLPARQEVVHAFSDHSKLRRCFTPSRVVPLRSGLQRMAAWARTCPLEGPSDFYNIEIDQNLPPSWRDQFIPQAPARDRS